MKLWFENSNGIERIIAECNTWNEVHKAIDEFIKECNNKKITAAKEKYGKDYDISKINLFKQYYTRVWEQADHRVRIDVGSHTEFFIWEGSMDDVRAG